MIDESEIDAHDQSKIIILKNLFWILKPYQTNRVLPRVFWVWSLKGVRPRVSV
jgi:hypothetical protein